MKLMIRLLSFLWPVRMASSRGRHGPLEVNCENGRLVMNSASANQSFGGLHRVWQRGFRAVRLRERKVDRVLLLGLGAGSVVSILRGELGIKAAIVAVDDDAEMLRLAREHFGLGTWADLEVVQDDAFRALDRIAGPFDLIAVDLFIEQDVPQALLDPTVIRRLAERISPYGLLMVNMIGHDRESTGRVEVMEHQLRERFAEVQPLRPYGVNVVFAAMGQRS